MSLMIFYFLLLGMITFANGINRNYYRTKKESGLQNILQQLSKQQGKFDIQLSHREDGPNSRHEDKARIYRHDEKPYRYDNNYKSSKVRHRHGASHERVINSPRLTNIQNLNFYSRKKFKNIARTGNNDEEAIANVMDTETDRFCKKEPKVYNCKKNCEAKPPKCSRKQDDSDNDKVDEVLQFLNDFDIKLEKDGTYNVDLRCVGNNRCEGINDRADDSRNYEDRDNNELRGKGKSRGKNRDEDYKRHSSDRELTKVDKNVDALILDTSIQDLLSKLNVKKSDVYRL